MAKPLTTSTQMHSTESSSGYVLFKTFNAFNPSLFYHLSCEYSLFPFSIVMNLICIEERRTQPITAFNVDYICVFQLSTDE